MLKKKKTTKKQSIYECDHQERGGKADKPTRYVVNLVPSPAKRAFDSCKACTRYMPPIRATCATMCLVPCSSHDNEPHNRRLLCPLYPAIRKGETGPYPVSHLWDQSSWRVSQGIPGQRCGVEGAVLVFLFLCPLSSDVVIQIGHQRAARALSRVNLAECSMASEQAHFLG